MNRIEKAVTCFEDGFNCSQAILSTFGPQYGLDREMALKVSGAFGAGIARMGDTCGAVTGAVMSIGLKYGKTRAEDDHIKEKAYELVKEFVKQFKSVNESILCRDLLGCDLSTPEGRSFEEENQICKTNCPKFVKTAAEILEQILLE